MSFTSYDAAVHTIERAEGLLQGGVAGELRLLQADERRARSGPQPIPSPG
jgi:hypothetical protein